MKTRRTVPEGSKYCARCGRGPLKNPYEVNGQTFGSFCKDKVSTKVQEVIR
ncbi:MAG: hypothetical protein HY619_07865 [Thaumarchaeota archaeon]|nr:hypothetical protein [Nitrososphaerota archaeon]